MENTEIVTESKEHTEGLKKLDESAIENPTLVAEVEDKLSRLQNLNELTKDENFNRLGEKTATSDEETDDTTPDETKDDSNAEESDQADDQTDSNDLTPEAETKDGDIKIPDAYMRAAIHHGLDKETVDDLVKKDPEIAMKMLESCYLSVNNASREWSELGRAKIEAERQQANVQTVAETVVQEDPAAKALIEKLKKEYPDDPLVDAAIVGLKKPVQQQQQQQPVPQQQQGYEVATARANAAGNLAIDQRVNTFFSAGVMTPYEKFYGKLELGQIPEDLSNGQQHNRLAVLEETEFIMAGHSMRGQKIELEQAMEKAHFIVTEPIRQQVIRDNLKATATKRQKGMTLKPSDSKRSNDSMTESSKPRNRRELELAVGQKLDSVFKK